MSKPGFLNMLPVQAGVEYVQGVRPIPPTPPPLSCHLCTPSLITVICSPSSIPLLPRFLQAGQWGGWSMAINSRPNEYQGTLRMRHNLQRCGPVDWVADGKKLLELIDRY